ncbi:MAG: MFS transporter [Eubacteriales bacterium]|nr:MFS transporter [Eubacteriales bacterium]
MNKEVNKYTLAVFLQTIGTGMVMTYMNLFMTDYLLITAAMVSTALLIAKFIDLFVSLIAGPIVERANFKSGKYLPWLKIIKWVLGVSFFLTYLDTTKLGLPMSLRAAIIVVAYVGFGGGMSILMIARGGLLQLMSGPNMSIRTKLSSRTAQATACATIICSAAALPIVTAISPIVGENNAYLVACMLLFTGMFVGCIIMAAQAKKYDVPISTGTDREETSVTMGDMVRSVAGNSQMLIVILAMGIFYIAMNVFTAVQAYYFRYIVNDYMFMATSMTIKTSFAFVASLIVPAIGRKLGKKNAFICGLIVYAIAHVGIMLFGAGSKIVFTLCTCIFTAAMYLFTSFGVNYFLDCGEYGYYKTGKDNRAVAMAMYNIPMKIGFMLGAAIGGYGLAIIGYEAGIVITTKFIHDFMFIIGAIPAILCVLAALILFFGYKITDADAVMYATANSERDRAAREAAASAEEQE